MSKYIVVTPSSEIGMCNCEESIISYEEIAQYIDGVSDDASGMFEEFKKRNINVTVDDEYRFKYNAPSIVITNKGEYVDFVAGPVIFTGMYQKNPEAYVEDIGLTEEQINYIGKRLKVAFNADYDKTLRYEIDEEYNERIDKRNSTTEEIRKLLDKYSKNAESLFDRFNEINVFYANATEEEKEQYEKLMNSFEFNHTTVPSFDDWKNEHHPTWHMNTQKQNDELFEQYLNYVNDLMK